MSGDAGDGEEFTNKILTMLMASTPNDRQTSGVDSTFATHSPARFEMCPIGTHFKHVQAADPDNPDRLRKVSSIMRTKVLSIMPVEAASVTAD